MIFTSLHYIFFLPLVVGLFWGIPKKHRIWVIAISSALFYASWNPLYLPLLLFVSLLSWGFGTYIHKKTELKNLSLLQMVFVLLIPLLFFKYSNWIIENINLLTVYVLGEKLAPIPKMKDIFGMEKWILPVGISFFTFQAIAYIVDVYRDKEYAKSPITFFSFLAFFPQLVAGPIVRRKELLPQLEKLGYLQKGMVSEGIYRIMKGMIKKLLIADLISKFIVTAPFETPSDYSSFELWIALYSYTIQIYYDFSAYTDIAIGSSLLFGIRLPENFYRPYKATSVAEFWRRWHRTLSDWIRDYIYYPLGGSQGIPTWKVYRNIMATLVIIGIWHGASWNFVLYGFLHGTAVCINRWQRKSTGRKAGMPFPNAFAWFWRFFLTFHFVVLARILFKAPDLMIAAEYFSNLWLNEWPLFAIRQDAWYFIIPAVGFALHFSPESWEEKTKTVFSNIPPAIQALITACVGGICLWWLSNSEHASTFIYYNF